MRERLRRIEDELASPAVSDISVLASASEAPPDATSEVPRWLWAVSFILAAAALAYGAAGLVLAINAVYRAVAAFAIGTVLLVGLIVLAWPSIARPVPSTRRAQVAAIVGVIIILGITGWNAKHASQHVLINRDGGSYLNTGRWIARDGSLEVHPRIGPFKTEPSLQYVTFAEYDMRNGVVQMQFAHLFPVLLAEAYAIGHDRGLLHAPELLSGVALLTFFVLAWRLLKRPWFAVAATTAFALLIPQVSFSRDSYSEIPTQILLFTGIALLVSARGLPPARLALTAGLVLGALEAVRVDAIVFLLGLPPLMAYTWLRMTAGSDARREARRRTVALAIGVVPGFLLGYIDLSRHSGRYFSDLEHDVHQEFAGLAASIVLSTVVVVAWPLLVRVWTRVRAERFAIGAGVAVSLVGFSAWAFRPRLETTHATPYGLIEGLQRAEHQPVNAARAYYEYSLTWMSWYLGPITLIAAILGAGLLVAALWRGRARHAVAAVALLGPAAALYLWRANAVSDQVWLTRRFLISAFPALMLLAFGFIVFLWTRRAIVARVLAVGFVIAAIAAPAIALRPVRDMSEQRGFLSVITDACGVVGKHAPIVVVGSQQTSVKLFESWVTQALRSWCGADVATIAAPNPELVTRLARGWKAEGRTLYIAAATAEVARETVPNQPALVPTRIVVNTHMLEQTLTHRPRAYVAQVFSMVLAAVPAS